MIGRCARCGADTLNSYGWCDDCRQAHGAAERDAQGLPERIDDPVAIDKARTILASAPPAESEVG